MNQNEETNKKDTKDEGVNMPIFLCMGLSVGMAIGASVGNIPVGMCVGMGIGLLVGVFLDSQKKRKPSEDQKEKEQ